MELFEQCFNEANDLPITQKAIAAESAFAIKRSSGAHYLALKQLWENLILHCDTSVDHCPSAHEISEGFFLNVAYCYIECSDLFPRVEG